MRTKKIRPRKICSPKHLGLGDEDTVPFDADNYTPGTTLVEIVEAEADPLVLLFPKAFLFSAEIRPAWPSEKNREADPVGFSTSAVKFPQV